jgi:hypothetical protein
LVWSGIGRMLGDQGHAGAEDRQVGGDVLDLIVLFGAGLPGRTGAQHFRRAPISVAIQAR